MELHKVALQGRWPTKGVIANYRFCCAVKPALNGHKNFQRNRPLQAGGLTKVG